MQQKISYKLLDKLNGRNKAEVDFMLYLCQMCGDDGTVNGVYYRDAHKDTGISITHFYEIIKTLTKDHIILAEHYKGHINITIPDNDFIGKDGKLNFSGGYIALNRQLLHDENFKKLKANAKLLALHLIKTIAGRKYKKNAKEFYKFFAEAIDVQKRILHTYIEDLREIFDITEDEKNIEIKLTGIVKNRTGLKGIKKFNEHNLNYELRRNRMKYTKEDYIYLLSLLKQYKTDIFTLCRAVLKSLIFMNDRIINEYRWNTHLQPRLVHTFLRSILGLKY